MKKIFSISAIALVILVSGCKNGGGGDPKAALNHFFTAIAKKDFTEAKKYATKDSESMLSMMQMGMQQQMGGDHSDKMMEMVNNMEIENPTIKGDEATVPVKDKKSGEVTEFLMKKESGDWKVAFDMGTLMNMASKKMKEHGFGNPNNGDTSEMEFDSATSHLHEKMDQAQKLLDSLREAQKK